MDTLKKIHYLKKLNCSFGLGRAVTHICISPIILVSTVAAVMIVRSESVRISRHAQTDKTSQVSETMSRRKYMNMF